VIVDREFNAPVLAAACDGDSGAYRAFLLSSHRDQPTSYRSRECQIPPCRHQRRSGGMHSTTSSIHEARHREWDESRPAVDVVLLRILQAYEMLGKFARGCRSRHHRSVDSACQPRIHKQTAAPESPELPSSHRLLGPLRGSRLGHGLHFERKLDVVAQQKATSLERRVPAEPPVLAVQLAAHDERGALESAPAPAFWRGHYLPLCKNGRRPEPVFRTSGFFERLTPVEIQHIFEPSRTTLG
jgi:hypothetical protein